MRWGLLLHRTRVVIPTLDSRRLPTAVPAWVREDGFSGARTRSSGTLLLTPFRMFWVICILVVVRSISRLIDNRALPPPFLLPSRCYTVPILGMLCGGTISGMVVAINYVLKEVE